jgi:hypothetical protein
MVAPSFPQNCKLFIDGEDVTYYIFGVTEFSPDATTAIWRDIDITDYLASHTGIHKIEIVPTSGSGRAEIRLEIR